MFRGAVAMIAGAAMGAVVGAKDFRSGGQPPAGADGPEAQPHEDAASP